MKPVISIIVCTYNPRHDHLDKVLKALMSQTLPMEQWELLLVDNASNQVLSSEVDLSWHPNAHHLREEQLGKTHALLRGIEQAVAETLIIVDDDNVLDTDYLEVALQISKNWPILGAWGGQIRPDFEEPPPDWTKPYWWMLAIREFEQDKWSNLLHNYETVPCGAGMCVRRVVAEKYAGLVSNNQKRANLDPIGKSLLRCGDSDLAFTSCDIRLGTGQFVSLKLTHLLPNSRLQEKYLLRLAEGISYSNILLDYFRNKMPVPQSSWKNSLRDAYHLWLVAPRESRFYKADKRGKALAIKEILDT